MTEPVLDVRELRVSFRSRRGAVRAVDGVSFSLNPGEILGIVGESGCGKSTLCSSLVRMLPANAEVTGTIRFRGHNLVAKSDREMRSIRGREITMILQNPMTAMDPLFTVGSQFDEILRHNAAMPAKSRRERALEMMGLVQIPSPLERLTSYPHQMSGGMKQRVLTAMATALKPGLLLADEPTTALDVTIQEQILRLLVEIRDRLGTAIILVTHDLGIVRRLTDRVVIMYAGRAVETGETEAIFTDPKHPYTQALLASIPRIGQIGSRLRAIEGTIPDLTRLPAGCAFAPRCAAAMPHCFTDDPIEVALGNGRNSRCWLHAEGRP